MQLDKRQALVASLSDFDKADLQKGGKMAKKIDARQYYKDYFNIDFGNEYVVCHMDLNSSNNDIDNLLLMPKNLYSRYNMLMSGLNGSGGNITIDFKIEPNCNGINLYEYNAAKQLCETMAEIDEWVKKKCDLQAVKSNTLSN